METKGAVMIYLSTRCWEGAKMLSPEVMERIGDKNWLKGRKHLVAPEIIAPIRAVTTLTRSRLASLALPFPIPGIYLVPKGMLERVEELLQSGRAAYWEEVNTFLGKYASAREKAAEKLGEYFNEEDYPANVRSKFGYEWQYITMESPEEGSLLDYTMYEREKNRFVGLMDEAKEMATMALRAEFAELVKHAAERLADNGDGKPKVFRDSMVEKFNEFFANFDARNSLFDDKKLASIVAEAKAALSGTDAEALRNDVFLRKTVGANLAKVKEAMDGAVMDRPLRKIRSL